MRHKTQFGAFVKKEFTHILRDKRTMMILFLTPIILILLFSYAISTEIRNVNVAVVVPDEDSYVMELARKIDASSMYDVVAYLPSATGVEPLIRKGTADLALIFEDSFSAKLLSADGTGIDIMVDSSNPNNASAESMYIMGIIRDWMVSKAGSSTASSGTGSISGNVRMMYNPQMQSSFNFVPGILGLILMLICALMTSVSVVREKETGTMEVLLVSPVKPINIILAKMIPYFVMGCIDLLIILLMSTFLLGLPMAGSLFWIVTSSLVYIALGLAIGLLVSNIATTQVAASLVCAIVFLVPNLTLSGMMFPLESMPMFFQVVANIVPAKWFIIILRKLMIQGVPFYYVIKEFTIMVVMAVVVLFAALKTFKDKLE